MKFSQYVILKNKFSNNYFFENSKIENIKWLVVNIFFSNLKIVFNFYRIRTIQGFSNKHNKLANSNRTMNLVSKKYCLSFDVFVKPCEARTKSFEMFLITR